MGPVLGSMVRGKTKKKKKKFERLKVCFSFDRSSSFWEILQQLKVDRALTLRVKYN